MLNRTAGLNRVNVSVQSRGRSENSCSNPHSGFQRNGQHCNDSNEHDRRDHDNDTSLGGIAVSIKTLIRAQTDMQQTMEQKFRSMEGTLNTRLQEMEHSQQTVNDNIAELGQNFEDLLLENERLRKELQNQGSRLYGKSKPATKHFILQHGKETTE